MEIVPALLETDRGIFSSRLDVLARFAKRIQVDFNDGSFGGLISLRPADIADLITDHMNKIEFEAHLMVQKPYDYIPRLIKSGFKKMIIQYEIEDDIREIIEQLKLENVLLGLAIGPGTALVDVEPFAELLDTMTVMDVEPGEQGQKFMPQELQKIRELRGGSFVGEVQADGGINDKNISEVAEAGANAAVVGSYIVESSDPISRYEELKIQVAERR